QNLASPAGNGLITSSPSASKTTMDNVNGVAFDANGRAFLGAGSEMRRYSQPSWNFETTVTDDMDGSTDLASCGSPATVTLRKNVQGRNASGDQFTLTLRQGGASVGTATTTGVATGVQAQQVGPQPTARGAQLTFSETASGTTNLSNYAT